MLVFMGACMPGYHHQPFLLHVFSTATTTTAPIPPAPIITVLQGNSWARGNLIFYKLHDDFLFRLNLQFREEEQDAVR
jgi:hypothetical protein